MSFLAAVRRKISTRQPNDPVRMTLEYLLENAVGRQNAVPLPTIAAELRSRAPQHLTSAVGSPSTPVRADAP